MVGQLVYVEPTNQWGDYIRGVVISESHERVVIQDKVSGQNKEVHKCWVKKQK